MIWLKEKEPEKEIETTEEINMTPRKEPEHEIVNEKEANDDSYEKESAPQKD